MTRGRFRPRRKNGRSMLIVLKLGEQRVLGFSQSRTVPIDIFCKNAVLNICRYLKHFYTYKKVNSIILKFDHSLLRMSKIIGIG